MKKTLTLILVTLFSYSFVFSQNNSTKKADRLYDRLEFVKAAEEYLKLDDSDLNSEYVITKLANCFYNLFETREAEKWFKKIINKNLTKKQKEIMFDEGTERPFSSDLLRESRKGFYHCANCGNKLFASTSKFDSGTGWPSFTEALPGAFKTKIDYSFGMKRTEYHCAKCGAHHGHVFEDGPGENGMRFCNNGLCLIFKPTN